MQLVEAVRTALSKYTDFTGRANRPEYWWFFLASFLANAVVSAVSDTLATILALGLLLPSIAAGVRRLHDTGKPGTYLLVALIPIVGWILAIVWLAAEGQPGDNAYGAPSTWTGTGAAGSPPPPPAA